MKASIKFRDEQKPLLRAKIPLNILNLPFQSGVTAGQSKELSLNLSTYFDFGPSLKLSYRPNDSQNPYNLIFKTGIGHFGSPIKSPVIMSAEFNLAGNHQNPRFLIHFKPDFGDFSLKNSRSSGFVKDLGGKFNGGVFSGEDFVNNGCFKGNAFFPAAAELLKGTELSARTALPLRDSAVVNFRWGFRVPPREATAEELDAVVVGKGSDLMAGIRLPFLVMNKVGIEHVAKDKLKKVKVGSERGDVAGACLEVKKQLEVIQAENGLLSKALSDLRSDIAKGKMDFLPENRNKYSNCGDKKSSDAKGNELKGV